MTHAAAGAHSVSGQRNGLRPAGNAACVERLHGGRGGGLETTARTAATAGPAACRRPDRTRPDDVRCRCAGCRFRDDSGDAANSRASPHSGSLRWNWQCSPASSVRTDPRALRQILGDLVSRAIEQSPCGRVLLVAAHVGGRVQITVSDDGPHPDRALQASRLRPAERLAALQGATMEIDARAGQGTTVVLRLPAGVTSRRPGIEADALDPASAWALAERERERAVPPGGNGSSAASAGRQELADVDVRPERQITPESTDQSGADRPTAARIDRHRMRFVASSTVRPRTASRRGRSAGR